MAPNPSIPPGNEPSAPGPSSGQSWFATTHWSVVLAAGAADTPDSQAALDRLCRAYWMPLYVYVRRRGHAPAEAQDLVQEFFARFLAKKYFALADPARGRFRNFLLTAMQHFLAGEWRKAVRQKRGGGQPPLSWEAEQAEKGYAVEPADSSSPERLYERRWAMTVLERAHARLEQDYRCAGKERLFDELKGFAWGEKSDTTHAGLGARLGMTEGAVKVAVHRLRRRYGALLREEIMHTVAHPDEVDEELRYLIRVVSEP